MKGDIEIVSIMSFWTVLGYLTLAHESVFMNMFKMRVKPKKVIRDVLLQSKFRVKNQNT